MGAKIDTDIGAKTLRTFLPSDASVLTASSRKIVQII
jgi:hypothetical protein